MKICTMLWGFELSKLLNLSRTTFYLSVAYYKLLKVKREEKDMYIASLYIASQLNESYPPTVEEIVSVGGGSNIFNLLHNLIRSLQIIDSNLLPFEHLERSKVTSSELSEEEIRFLSEFDVQDKISLFKERGPYRRKILAKKIGEGVYGSVYKTNHNGRDVAVKYSRVEELQYPLREISVMTRIAKNGGSPFLVDMLQYNVKIRNRRFFSYIVMPLMSGTLYDLRDEVKCRKNRKNIIVSILEGLNFLHSLGILHRDIKPDNILLSSTMEVKICDFGLSRMIYDTSYDTSCGASYNYGTPYGISYEIPPMTAEVVSLTYKAPEIIPPDDENVDFFPIYSSAIDIWSSALVYHFVVTGSEVFYFKGEPPSKILETISELFSDNMPSKSFFTQDFEEWEISVLSKMLNIDPGLRYDAKSSLDHIKSFDT